MITATPEGITIDIRVIPRAATSAIAGTRDGALLVRLTAPPVDGAANTELIELLAKALGVPKRNVAIVAGERSRQKHVRVTGVSVAAVTAMTERAAQKGTERPPRQLRR